MRRRYTTLSLATLDVACAFGVFNLATLVRGLGSPGDFLFGALIAPIAMIVLALSLIDGYSPRVDMLSVEYASQHAIAMMVAMVATLMLTYVFVSAGYELQSSRLVISLSFLGIAAVTLGYRRIIYLRRMPVRGHRGILFVGDRQSCEHFRDECLKTGMQRPVIYATATVSDPVEPPTPDALGSLRPFSEVLGEVEAGQTAVEAIVLRESARELPADLSRRLVQLYVDGAPTYTLELFHQIYWRKIPLYRLNPTWLFQEGFRIAREPVFERLKRVSDVALSLAGLLLGAPILLAAALAVWLEDRGPPFFSQTRIGRNHVPFRLLKLRTMRTSPLPGGRYTQPDDPRITRVGRFLRVTRLDELPQLWNVLRGEMSLIGPRAEWDLLVETYEREISCYHFRHLVKPGITGWAQVNYPYGASLEDTIRKLEYDLYYIRHFSFLLDATIVLKTIHIVLFGKGR